MLWIEPCSMIYASMFGALVGSTAMSLTFRRTQRENMDRLESFWVQDLQNFRKELKELDSRCQIRSSKLSTKTVDKSVANNKKINHHKAHRHI